jgi:hypothetical protein
MMYYTAGVVDQGAEVLVKGESFRDTGLRMVSVAELSSLS